jgi:hypothetical protein
VQTGLEIWADALGDGLVEIARNRVAASPRFREALRNSVDSALRLYNSDPVLHRNAKDIGCFVLGLLALYCDATGGLTHTRLRSLTGGAGIMSMGRASAILWQLRRIGYIEAEVSGKGRAYRYVPTEEMYAAFRARFRVEYESMALIEPGLASALACFDEPQFSRALMEQLGRHGIDAVGTPFSNALKLNAYSEKNAGMLILFALLQAGTGDTFPPVGPVEFSLPALATRFEVSRSHVRRLLKELESMGYYRPLADGRGFLEAKLAEDLTTYFSINWVGLTTCAHAALEASAAEYAIAAS